MKAVIFFLMVLHTACAAAAWQSVGPDSVDGRVVATSASSPNTILLGTQSGLYRSFNAGNSWQRIGHLREPIVQVWIHPSNSTLFFALTNTRLYRSNDAGASWALLGAGLPRMASTQLNSFAIVLNQGQLERVYVTDRNEGLFKSMDGGHSFARVSVKGFASGLRYKDVTIDPAQGSPVLLTGDNGLQGWLYRSTDDATTFSLLVTDPLCLDACKPRFGGTNSDQLFFASLRSLDAGASFSTIEFPVTSVRPMSDEVYRWSSLGIYRSLDAGSSWAGPISMGGLENDNNFTEIAEIAWLPTGSSTAGYVLSTAGSFYRFDGSQFARSNSGLRANTVRAIAAHSGGGRALAGLAFEIVATPPLFGSEAGGTLWSRSFAGLEFEHVRDIEFDPNSGSNPEASVVFAVGRDFYPAVNASLVKASIARSSDGGRTWTHPPLTSFSSYPALLSRPIGVARNLAIDPSVVVNGVSQRVYFSATGSVDCNSQTSVATLAIPRLWKSVDGGASWNSADGLPLAMCSSEGKVSLTPKDIVIDPSNPATLYVGSFLNGSSSFNLPNGVFKSTDGGATWAHSSNGLPRQAGATTSVDDVLALAIDPTNPSVLYAGLSFEAGVGRGIYKTIDGGQTWTASGLAFAGEIVREVRVDGNKVYAVTSSTVSGRGGVYVSNDGGAIWHSIGRTLRSAFSIELERNSASPGLLIGTSSGLWRSNIQSDSDLDGSPDVIEASAPFGGDGNQDGIADSMQAKVVSLAGVSSGPSNATVIATLTINGTAAATCQQVNDAEFLPANEIAHEDTNFRFPFGVLRFDIQNCPQASVSLRVHSQMFDASYRLRNFGREVLAEITSESWRDSGAQVSGSSWSFELNDNQAGDNSADANRLVFIGAPATETLFKSGFE